MKIQIKTTTISLTPAISDYVEKRLEAVKKFMKDDPTAICDVEIGKTTNHHRNGDIFKAEIHLVAKNQDIYANVEKEDLYAAIDEVKDEVVRKITSTKEKKTSLMRRGGAKMKEVAKGLLSKNK